MSTRARRSVRWTVLTLLILLVGASSAAYGSTELWSSEWLAFAALLSASVLLWTVPWRDLLLSPAGRLALPLVLFVAWGFVQTIPMPAAVLRLLSPTTAAFYAETVPPGGADSLPRWLLDRAQNEGTRLGPSRDLPAADPDPGNPLVGRTFSIQPFSTREACRAWLTPILLFLAAAWVAKKELARYVLVWAIGSWTAAWGLALVLQLAGWKGAPIWRHDITPDSTPVLPFVSKNHFAGFVEMGTLVILGLFFAFASRVAGRPAGSDRVGAAADRAWVAPRLLGSAVFVLLGVVGVLFSGSRGGVLALAMGLAFFAAARHLRGRISLAVIAVILLGVLVGLPALVSPDRSSLQTAPFVSTESDDSLLARIDAWTRTLRIFFDHPVVGTGLGTFKWAFSLYERQGEWMILKEAHNDYLQALAETGLVGAVLLVWAFVVFLRRILVPALRAGSRPRWTTVGAASAVFALLVHSIVDFNLQIPSNAALFAIVLGLLAAAAADADEEAAVESAE